MSTNEWITSEHALAYLARADRLAHRTEGEAVLLAHVPVKARRLLDLGTGDGRLLALLLLDRPQAAGVALDFSPTMLQRAQERFKESPQIAVVAHNLNDPLPQLGRFDAVVSSFAIHHCSHERKQALYAEIFACLEPGGIFCNLEHVASPTRKLHERFLHAIGHTLEIEDLSNQLLDVETQLEWLRRIGFTDVDCYWKWLELALLIGVKPIGE
ncbi:MAG: class I SAM-dependent methyltransferase [Chloroflexi bacterium]|nr:MAG: class I SAM-dependent methyltransferase [Chloroflexota bacterium]